MAPSKIVDDLSALATPIDQLTPKPGNPNDGDVPAVARSLDRFGQRKPVVANRSTGYIEAGHTLVAAARTLEWEEVAVVWVDDDPAAELGFALADNRTRDLAEYTPGALGAWVVELHEMDTAMLEDAGFDAEDAADFMTDLGDDAAPDAGMMGTPSMTPKDREQAYQGANVRSILLPLDLTRYAWAVRHLAEIRAELEVADNASAVLRLIAERVGEEPPDA